MKILVLNCGSSSIKYQLFNIESEEVLGKGIVEKVGMKGSFMKYDKKGEETIKLEGEIIDHKVGIEYILGVLTDKSIGCISNLQEIEAVGHRVAHGGEKFDKSVLITDSVIDEIEDVSELAPLHNPANLKGIYAMELLLPEVAQVAVFDTAFHQTIPAKAFMYALPHSLYKKYGIRRYGFHGTSHKYVAKRACDILGIDYNTQKIITLHLGNGASAAAIKNGKSVDTSMGLTPVEGLIMGTRVGDVDAGALTFIMEKEEISAHTLNTLINKHSGILGVTGVSSDMREVEAAAKEGNERAKLGLDMFHYRIKGYVGQYAAIMGGVDLIVFTGGIGENGQETRAEICNECDFLGVNFDTEKNKVRGEETLISAENSKVKVMIIPTNEELVIARDTQRVIAVNK